MGDILFAIVSSNITIYSLWAIIAMGLGVFLLDLMGLLPIKRPKQSQASAASLEISPKATVNRFGVIRRIRFFGGQPRWAKISIGAIIIIIGWHFVLVITMNLFQAQNDFSGNAMEGPIDSVGSVFINPLTNLVTIKIMREPQGTTDGPLGLSGDAIVNVLFEMVGPKFLEPKLNAMARAYYDLYAMLIPYKVRIVMVLPN